ncbi:MAG: pyruvate dehydrogenase (acetyl-transferring) E1 component subunit alpha, partial [Acidimicrobiia bacterium]|nr:pyruvate dehydrogenase (acetyl-transferring) E1 component subunit alpha [Acidimicrobiia bacterium]
GGHSRADPGKYRPDEEVAEWLRKDPLDRYKEQLVSEGIDLSSIDSIDAETLAKVDDATQFVRDDGPPDESLVYKDVWADGGWAWRN